MTDTFESTFRAIYDEAFDIMVERQRKYGPENVRQLGLYGVFSRLASDKIERIRRALNGRVIHGEVLLDDLADFGDESFDDALLDVANYAFILLALRRGVWGRPLEEEADDETVRSAVRHGLQDFGPAFDQLAQDDGPSASFAWCDTCRVLVDAGHTHAEASLCYPQADGCNCSTIAGHLVGSEGCVHGR